MRNWVILLIIALMALILGLQYAGKKKTAVPAAPAATGRTQQDGPAGVGLPSDSGPDGAFVDTGSYDPDKSACAGGSVGEILGSYNTTWGPKSGGQSYSLKRAATEKLQKGLADYFYCRAFAARDAASCGNLNNLPSDKQRDCRLDLGELFSVVYAAGKLDDNSFCVARLKESEADFPFLAGRDHAALCAAAVKGCEGLAADEKKQCLTLFPRSKEDCAGARASCLEYYGLYRAIMSGDPADCPSSHSDTCRPFVARSAAECSSLAAAVSRHYCAELEKARDASPEAMLIRQEEARQEDARREAAKHEAAERLAAEHEAAKQAERERLEREKLLEQINKEIRKSMGKK
ncbi:MAG TPA: MAP7 domain-containing protein [Elusimicrobiales bacterium]|nr:MAP7 domain-containing protein [Elusimicrobiales bacterium]